MNEKIMRNLGFGKQVDDVKKSKCPICGKKIDPTVEFKDPLSRKEYDISGMCQDCQDKIFGD